MMEEAVFAPIPRARIAVTAAVKPGLLPTMRQAVTKISNKIVHV